MRTFKQYLKEELESNLDFKRFGVRRFYEWCERRNVKESSCNRMLEAEGMVRIFKDRSLKSTPLEITEILGQPEILGDTRNYRDDNEGVSHFYWGIEFVDGIKAIIAHHSYGVLPPDMTDTHHTTHLDAGTKGKEKEIMQRIKALIKIKKYKLNKNSENMFGNIIRSV